MLPAPRPKPLAPQRPPPRVATLLPGMGKHAPRGPPKPAVVLRPLPQWQGAKPGALPRVLQLQARRQARLVAAAPLVLQGAARHIADPRALQAIAARRARAIQIPVPIVPAGAVLPPVVPVVLGVAPVINVANNEYFGTTWAGLTIAMTDIPLRHGFIRVNGHSTTITVEKRGRAAKGDISQISRFIKKHFKHGGVMDGRKMTSQRLIRTIVSKLPGTFQIVF